eukprot:6492527-Amphidinium_carterae.4
MPRRLEHAGYFRGYPMGFPAVYVSAQWQPHFSCSVLVCLPFPAFIRSTLLMFSQPFTAPHFPASC